MRTINFMVLVIISMVMIAIAGCTGGVKKPNDQEKSQIVEKSIVKAIETSRVRFQTPYGNLKVAGIKYIAVKKIEASSFGQIVEKTNKDGIVKKMIPVVVDGAIDVQLFIRGLAGFDYFNTEHVKYTVYIYQNEEGKFDFENGTVEMLPV
jgi:hypothetical protein